jgi:diguanylate cyclase (GGDEF)-like protein
MRSVLYHRDFASDDPQGELYRAGLLRRSWVERVLFPGLEHQEAPGRATQPFLLVTTWQLGWTELRWKVLAVISGTALASFLVSLVYARLYHTRQMERLAEADRLFRLANYDGLTGLPNRNLFLDRLRQALAKARRERRDLSVLFVDLDGFKAVNDTYGHDVGDEILRLSGERIRGCLRESDTVARRSGDELVVLLESAGGRAQAARLGEKVEDAFRAPFPVGGHEVPVGASVGYASFPEDGSDPAALLRAADGSMYARKAERQALARRVAASSGAPGRRTA